jgi:hypothetical protein
MAPLVEASRFVLICASVSLAKLYAPVRRSLRLHRSGSQSLPNEYAPVNSLVIVCNEDALAARLQCARYRNPKAVCPAQSPNLKKPSQNLPAGRQIFTFFYHFLTIFIRKHSHFFLPLDRIS